MKKSSLNIFRITVAVLLCAISINVTAQDNAKEDTLHTFSAIDAADVEEDVNGQMVTEFRDTTFSLSKKENSMLEKIARKKPKRDWTTWKPDPKRAMWLAIVLPGAGQIYNRKYWKLPILYGGLLGCAYAMRWNNQMYMDYSQAYLDIMDDDPNTKSYNSFLHLGTEITPANEDRYKQIFKSRKDKYRRWRDMSFFVMLGVYGLSIVDAYVDAQLSQFDISDDLSLHLEPAVINGNVHSISNVTTPANVNVNTSAIGVRGALTF